MSLARHRDLVPLTPVMSDDLLIATKIAAKIAAKIAVGITAKIVMTGIAVTTEMTAVVVVDD